MVPLSLVLKMNNKQLILITYTQCSIVNDIAGEHKITNLLLVNRNSQWNAALVYATTPVHCMTVN